MKSSKPCVCFCIQIHEGMWFALFGRCREQQRSLNPIRRLQRGGSVWREISVLTTQKCLNFFTPSRKRWQLMPRRAASCSCACPLSELRHLTGGNTTPPSPSPIIITVLISQRYCGNRSLCSQDSGSSAESLPSRHQPCNHIATCVWHVLHRMSEPRLLISNVYEHELVSQFA